MASPFTPSTPRKRKRASWSSIVRSIPEAEKEGKDLLKLLEQIGDYQWFVEGPTSSQKDLLEVILGDKSDLVQLILNLVGTTVVSSNHSRTSVFMFIYLFP